MSTHELKTDSEVFRAVLDGTKTYEIRKNDRGFAVGDMLVLRETLHTGRDMAMGSPLVYTGREVVRRVSHMLTGPIYGLAAGWSILSLTQVTAASHRAGEVPDQINKAAGDLIALVLDQCGGYTHGPGFEAAQKARYLRASLMLHSAGLLAATPAPEGSAPFAPTTK
jgi:hypothetical protein